MVPLKTKTGSALVEAFTTIFKQGRKPDKLQTDAGTEFKNKTFQTFLKQRDIHHFVTYNETKAQIVERFNRTLKQMMWRLFTTRSSYHYLDKLHGLVNYNYNQSMHRSIKMKPSQLTVMNAQMCLKVFKFAQSNYQHNDSFEFPRKNWASIEQLDTHVGKALMYMYD